MTDEIAKKLHATTDAKVWAEEFMNVVRSRAETETPIDIVNEGLMIGWFANAMSVASTETVRRSVEIPSDRYCHLMPGDVVIGDGENYPEEMKMTIQSIDFNGTDFMVKSNPDYGQKYYAKYLRRV